MRWNLRMDVEAIMACERSEWRSWEGVRVSGEHGGRVADDRDDLSGVARTRASNLHVASVHFLRRI